MAGAAIASAISYTLSGILMFVFFRKKAQFSWKWKSFSVEKGLLKECFTVGAPVLGTSLVSCFGYVVFASLVSGMGTTVFAAHSIAVTAETIFYVPGYGLRTATSALIGNARGERDLRKLKTVAWLSVLLTLALMCISGLALFLGANPLMGLFSPVEEVVKLGGEMLQLVALSEPFFGLMVVLEGVFYGPGPHPVRLFGGNHRHVGGSHPVHLPLRPGMGIGPAGSMVLHDRRQCLQSDSAAGALFAKIRLAGGQTASNTEAICVNLMRKKTPNLRLLPGSEFFIKKGCTLASQFNLI